MLDKNKCKQENLSVVILQELMSIYFIKTSYVREKDLFY